MAGSPDECRLPEQLLEFFRLVWPEGKPEEAQEQPYEGLDKVSRMANPEQLAILERGVNAWNHWRLENPNVTPELRLGNFQQAGLDGADFNHAVLFGANFTEATLVKCNFSRAYLSAANLGWADLRNANLEYSHLDAANLSCAELEGSDFTGARFSRTSLGDVDLTMAKGLNKVTHSGPSSIGIDTLLRSRNIPIIFLQRADLPESFITYARSLIGQPIQFYSCFISYSHADKSFARRLHDTL